MIWETYCITARLMLAKTDSPWTHGKVTSLRTGLSRASFFVAKNFILVGVFSILKRLSNQTNERMDFLCITM